MVSGLFLSAAEDLYPLWTDKPVPTSAELLPIQDVQFYVIKKNEPEADNYHWLHGLALAWHKGRLYSTFGHNKGAENTASEEARGRISDDGGKTWGPIFTIDDGKEPDLAVSHGVLLSQGGHLWSFNGAFYRNMEQVHTRAYLLDESTGQWIPKGIILKDGYWPLQEPQKMKNGNWIMSGIRALNGYGGTDDPAAVAISHGDDFTKWDLVVIPKPKSMVMWGESTVIFDGTRIINIARYGEPSKALVAISENFGRTWTSSQISNLSMTGSKPYSGILSTGQNYLIGTTTGDADHQRYPLTIAITDPGKTRFNRIYRIRNAVQKAPGESNPRAALSYPYAVEKDGKLYIAYSNDGGRGANKNSAELAIIPVCSFLNH